MSFAYCITHNEVSPWGCRHCRRAAMDRDLQIAVEATRQAMHDAFHDALKKETAMTPADIIARAYDREQAAQMGEPDPWADGTDHPEWSGSLACAHEAIAALNAAGYRILAPGERDPVTIEAAPNYRDLRLRTG